MTINNWTFFFFSDQFLSNFNKSEMHSYETSNFAQLINLYPLLKDEEQDRIKIFISGKQFLVQNRQVRSRKIRSKSNFVI